MSSQFEKCPSLPRSAPRLQRGAVGYGFATHFNILGIANAWQLTPRCKRGVVKCIFCCFKRIDAMNRVATIQFPMDDCASRRHNLFAS